MSKQNQILATLVLLSACMAAVEIILNAKGEVVSDRTQILWGVIFLITSTLWVIADAAHNDFGKPFDFDFLIYIFWPVALPYYLISTRGLDGAVYFLGLVSLLLGPWLVGLVACTYLNNP